jgi:hypothetical protein
VERTFVRVPLGASGMEVRVEVPEGSRQQGRGFLHDPEGRRMALPTIGGAHHDEAVLGVPGRKLLPGVWEFVRYAHFGNSEPLSIDLTVRFDGLAVETGRVTLKGEEGEPPKGSVTLTNRSRVTFEGMAAAKLVGYRLTSERDLGPEPLELDVPLGPDVEALELHVSMSQASWSRFTDVAVRILDEEGEAVLSDAMTWARLSARLDSPSPGESARLTLEVVGAVADPDDTEESTTLTIERTYRYAEPVAVAVRADEEDEERDGDDGDGKEPMALFPDRPADLTLECERTPPALPAGGAWIVELALEEATDGERTARVELAASPSR